MTPADRATAVHIAAGCRDYAGGFGGDEYTAYQTGISTVAAALHAWAEGENGGQLRVVQAIGCAARAAVILAELEATPEVAVLVAEGIGELKIARGWARSGHGADRRPLLNCSEDIAAVRPGFSFWCVSTTPTARGPCTSTEDGMTQADAVLRERGWRLM